MRLNDIIGPAALLIAVSPAGRATAQGITSKAQLMPERWDSSYTRSPDGEAVQARIRFNGDDGTYDTASGQGRLFRLEYGFDTSPTDREPTFQITGRVVVPRALRVCSSSRAPSPASSEADGTAMTGRAADGPAGSSLPPPRRTRSGPERRTRPGPERPTRPGQVWCLAIQRCQGLLLPHVHVPGRGLSIPRPLPEEAAMGLLVQPQGPQGPGLLVSHAPRSATRSSATPSGTERTCS